MAEAPLSRKRASRYKRPATPRRMRLTERDKQVIQAVNDFRVLRQDQIERLLFPSKNTAQVRLRLLWEHGYLGRHFLSVIGGVQTSPILYVLAERGAELLRQEFGYDATSLRWSRGKELSDRFLEHTLGLSELRLLVTLSSGQHGFRLKTWLDEKELKAQYDKVQVGVKLVPVLPDAYFVVTIPTGDLHFFLEYDRGPESLKFIKQKFAAYGVYVQSRQCLARYGTNRIRVLTVAEAGGSRAGRGRLAGLKSVAQELGGGPWFWFSSMTQLAKGDFLSAPVWERAEGEPVALTISGR